MTSVNSNQQAEKSVLDVNLKDFIGVFDNAIPHEVCDKLIEDFNLNYEQNLAFSRGSNLQSAYNPANPGNHNKLSQDQYVISNSLLVSDDSINYNDSMSQWTFNDNQAASCLVSYIGLCYSVYGASCAGNFNGLETPYFNTVKVQRTEPGKGYHIWHCEQSSRITAHRFLFYIAYLNDVEKGGETEFLYYPKRVEPKKGRVVIAPSSFTHTHRGNPPLSGEKFIATGWLEW